MPGPCLDHRPHEKARDRGRRPAPPEVAFAWLLRRTRYEYRAGSFMGFVWLHVILDNLNTYRLKSLTNAYGDAEGRRLWQRFVIHHTPKLGSWLNPAEMPAGSSDTAQALRLGRRISSVRLPGRRSLQSHSSRCTGTQSGNGTHRVKGRR